MISGQPSYSRFNRLVWMLIVVYGKISIMTRGLAKTPEAEAERRRKIGEAARGRKVIHSDETRRKISETLTGRKLSQEHRKAVTAGLDKVRDKISASVSANWERRRAELGQTAPGYFQLHSIVRKVRGKASNQRCAECGRQAQHWSQVHETDGTNPFEHYRPLCQKCHWVYDDVAARSIATAGPEGRSQLAKTAWSKRSPEQRSEIVKKAWITRKERREK